MRKYIIFLLMFSLLLPVLLLPISALSVAAEIPRDFATSSVDEDLLGADLTGYGSLLSKIENEGDIALVFPQKDAEPAILEVMETGYDPSRGALSPVVLYVWIYVPRPGFDAKSEKNKITLAKTFDFDPLDEGKTAAAEDWVGEDYTQYSLTHIGTSTSGTVHKYRIDGFSAGGCRYAHTRRYSISRFDLMFKNSAAGSAQYYKHGCSYICTGSFAAGDYRSRSFGLDVLEINNLYQTCYRFYNLESNVYSKNATQINSMYFSIPANYEAKYGDLFSISCDFTRYRMAPAIVTVDEPLFLEYTDYLLQDLSAVPEEKLPERSVYGVKNEIYAGSGNTSLYRYSYNYRSIDARLNNIDSHVSTLFWLFGFNGADGKYGNDLIDDAYISTDELLKKYVDFVKCYDTNYTNLVNKGVIQDTGITDTYGSKSEKILAGDLQDGILSGYQYSNWFSKLVDFLWNDLKEEEGIEGVTAIQKIDRAAYNFSVGKIDRQEETCRKYLIADADYDAFREFCDTETAKGNTVVVLHFANSVYETMQADVYFNTPLSFVRQCKSDIAYMFTQDIFLDFTVVQMEFEDDHARVAIPVASPNINVIGPGQSPGDFGTGVDDVDWMAIVRIFAVILVVILVLCFVSRLAPILAAANRISKDNAEAARRRREDRQNRRNGKR